MAEGLGAEYEARCHACGAIHHKLIMGLDAFAPGRCHECGGEIGYFRAGDKIPGCECEHSRAFHNFGCTVEGCACKSSYMDSDGDGMTFKSHPDTGFYSVPKLDLDSGTWRVDEHGRPLTEIGFTTASAMRKTGFVFATIPAIGFAWRGHVWFKIWWPFHPKAPALKYEKG